MPAIAQKAKALGGKGVGLSYMDKPLVTIHDYIAVLPNDMDKAQDRIRR